MERTAQALDVPELCRRAWRRLVGASGGGDRIRFAASAELDGAGLVPADADAAGRPGSYGRAPRGAALTRPKKRVKPTPDQAALNQQPFETKGGGRRPNPKNGPQSAGAGPAQRKELMLALDPAAELAKRELAARMLKELLPLPKVVQKFIDGKYGPGDAPVAEREKAAVPATEWLIKAVVHAHTDPKIKKAAIDLLVTGPNFSSNMSALGVFEEVFKPKIKAHLQQLGSPLKTRYDELDLGTVLGEAAVANLTSYHTLAVKAKAEGRALTMTEVLPDYPAEFRNAPENEVLELYSERCYLLSTLLLSMAVDGLFQVVVAKVARNVGLLEDDVRAAVHKSYVRARNKMDTKEDHRNRPKPRPAFNIDLIRCLAMTMTPEMSLDLYAALLERFGGAAKVKNLYALAEGERAGRFNLVSLMLTVIFDPKMSYAELCQRPETQRIWDKYLGAPHGEPECRWRAMGAVARRYLEGPAMASRPVLVLGEVQILLREFAEIRHEMHSPYKCERAADPAQLFADYLQGRPKRMLVGPAIDLWHACHYGQCDVAGRFIAEGSDVNIIPGGQVSSPLFQAADNNHLDVVRLLVSKGADVNQVETDDGNSPLFIASQNGHLDVVRLLVTEGADVNQASTLWADCSPLWIASDSGHLDVVQLLVSGGADVNQQNSNQQAPLNIAASNGDLDMVKLLVKSNANLNSKSFWGTPLQEALVDNKPEVAQYLRSKGAVAASGRQLRSSQPPLPF